LCLPKASRIFRVSPDGWTPERLVIFKVDEAEYGPQILPGVHAVLFMLAKAVDNDRWEKAKIVVHS